MTAYHSYNPHGNTAALTDEAGNLSASFGYDAFGNELTGSETAFGYTGKWQREKDSATQMIRMGVREYDPTLGRFISPDWLYGNQANPQTLNRYGYALNTPTVAWDPSGLYGESIYSAVTGAASDWWEGVNMIYDDPSIYPGAAYDFLIGDDIDTLLAGDASFGDRLIAGAFVGTTIIPQGKLAKLGALAKGTRLGAKAALGNKGTPYLFHSMTFNENQVWCPQIGSSSRSSHRSA